MTRHKFDYVNAIVAKRDALECRRLARMYKAWGWRWEHKFWMRDAIRQWKKHKFYVRRMRSEKQAEQEHREAA